MKEMILTESEMVVNVFLLVLRLVRWNWGLPRNSGNAGTAN